MLDQDTPEFAALVEAKRQQREKRHSKFRHGKAAKLRKPQDPPTLFLFVYGTLMDPKMLESILGRVPELCQARMIGYKVMMYEPYPALVKEPGQPVYGKAFEIDRENELPLLQAYETDMYRPAACRIFLDESDEDIVGKTFLWNRSRDELTEGEFDLAAL